MALQRAVMATIQLLFAGAATGWQRLATLDWWIKLRDIAGTVYRLDRDPLARFAVA